MTITPSQADRDAMKSILWVSTIIDDQDAIAQAFANHAKAAQQAMLEDIADMMREHVDNWPAPKSMKTALALISKTILAAVKEGEQAMLERLREPNDAVKVAGGERFGDLFEIYGGGTAPSTRCDFAANEIFQTMLDEFTAAAQGDT